MNYTDKDKKRIWSLRYTPGNSSCDEAIDLIAKQNGISRAAAGIIYNRGYQTAEDAASFLSASVADLHDPYLMQDMDKAVARIGEALMRHEHITVYGDYDVDGVTSVTLIYLYLQSLGAEIDYYIPSRSKEGYGISVMALDSLKEKGTRLIVTVDTGITANAEAEYARSLGLEMVITDHHECHGDLPNACAVVNPHRPDCAYPFKELAGVGVVFKLACAIEAARCGSLEEATERIFRQYADLAAIGSVADVMPLIDENRVIVKHGLTYLSETERAGLAALIEAAAQPTGGGRSAVGEAKPEKKRKINAGFIGFALAPRINAAGRISSAEKAVALLLSEDPTAAAEMAQELCEINTKRQREENKIAEEAYKSIEAEHDFSSDLVIVLDNDRWQQGIIGIVSSRITEKYGLPSILISFDGAVTGEPHPMDVGKGSGRSVKGMNLVDALDHCKDLLVRFGGHELAAGLSVSRANIPAFRQRINEYAREHLTEDLSVMRYEADFAVSPEDIGMALASELNALEPFGVANPTPVFLVRDLTVSKIISMGGGKHSKLLLSKGQQSFQAVWFGVAASTLAFYPGETVDLLCQISVNEFRGRSAVQLILQDVRLSESCSETMEREEARYRQVLEGAQFTRTEDILPTRAEIADIYKFFRYEGSIGHSSFSLRMLRALIGEYSQRPIGYAKLRFAIAILNDINVCRVDRIDEDIISVEVCKNAAKTNIELSETYKHLLAQCGE